MEIKRDRLPEPIRWMHNLVFRTDRGTSLWLGSNPFAVHLDGARWIVCTDGNAIAGIRTDEHPEIPAHDERLAKLAPVLGALADWGGDVFKAGALKDFAGIPLDAAIYFDNEGCGPFDVPRYRPALINGAHFDGDLVAHALEVFDDSDEVRMRTVGVKAPTVFQSVEGGKFAIVMPRGDVIPTIAGATVSGGWGRQ